MAEIRFAKKEELEQKNPLRAPAAPLHNQNRPDVYPPFSPALAEEALKLWEDSDADTIVAVQDGAAAGYAVVFYRDIPSSPHSVARRVCHIEEFAVDEAYRRRQIGAQLFDFIKTRAKEKGFCQIQLNVWDFNKPALAFYQAMGFQPFRHSMECRI